MCRSGLLPPATKLVPELTESSATTIIPFSPTGEAEPATMPCSFTSASVANLNSWQCKDIFQFDLIDLQIAADHYKYEFIIGHRKRPLKSASPIFSGKLPVLQLFSCRV
jgi:hypothetical protein